MSYSTLKDYALLSSANLHTAFCVGLLSTQEAKSDIIWVENKALIFEVIKKGFFGSLEEAVGTEFWQNWVNANFIEFVNLWAVAPGQRSLITHSVNLNKINIDSLPLEDSQFVVNLRDLIVLALDSSCDTDSEKLLAYSLMHKLGEAQFYEKIIQLKLSAEEFVMLITKGSDFFRFDQYVKHQKCENVQRIHLIYELCHVVLGHKKPKSTFTGKDEIHISPPNIVSAKNKLGQLKQWIVNTGLKTDVYLFDAIYRTYVFGNPGVKIQEAVLNFDWFIANSTRVTSLLGSSQVVALFEHIIHNQQTPVDTIVEKFDSIKNNFRSAVVQELSQNLLSAKFKTFEGSEIEKIDSICKISDKLTVWGDVGHLIDTSKTSIEEFCNWAVARYSNPQKFGELKRELLHLRAKFDVSMEQLTEMLENINKLPAAAKNVYIGLFGNCLQVKHPFIKQEGWFTEAMLDLSSSSGLNVNSCWNHMRQWLANNAKNSSIFLNALQRASTTFNSKNALDCLQKNALFAYVAITFIKEPNKLLSLEDNTGKKTKAGVFANVDFVDQALDLVKGIKGGFDAKKYLSTQHAMTYFASKRKGKNLFSRYEGNIIYNATTCLHYDKAGLPGLEVADPFEKGYSWGNYEKIAKLSRITDYGNIATAETRAKRFALYLFNYFVVGEPDAINAKLATTDAKSVSRVIAAISRSIGQYATFNTIVDNFNVLRENKAKIVEYFADKHQHLGNLVAVCKMFIETGKLMNPALLPYAEMFNNLSGMNLTDEDIEKYQTYMATALKNKVSMSYITRAIRHAGSFAQHNGALPDKNIKAEPVVLTDKGVKARILDKGDLRALTIGLEISCCQYLDGYASTCAVATYEDANYGIVLVDNIDQSKGTRPLAEAAVWISEGMVVIDSIEGLRKDASGYSKIAAAFDELIKQWRAQGLRVGISTTDYGMTVQICNKLRREYGYVASSVSTPARPLRNIYTDVGNYVYEFKKL